MAYDPGPVAPLLSVGFQHVNEDGSIDSIDAYLKIFSTYSGGMVVTGMTYTLGAFTFDGSTATVGRTLMMDGTFTAGKVTRAGQGVFTSTDTWSLEDGTWRLRMVRSLSGKWLIDGKPASEWDTNAPSATSMLPDGWKLIGSHPPSYTTIDSDTGGWNDGPTIGVIGGSDAARYVAGYAEVIPVKGYQGKTVRIFGMLKTTNVRSAGFFARVEGPIGTLLTIDSMRNRRLVGTKAWTPFSIVLRVPSAATVIGTGLTLVGGGSAYASDLQIEIVPDSTPVTGT